MLGLGLPSSRMEPENGPFVDYCVAVLAGEGKACRRFFMSPKPVLAA